VKCEVSAADVEQGIKMYAITLAQCCKVKVEIFAYVVEYCRSPNHPYVSATSSTALGFSVGRRRRGFSGFWAFVTPAELLSLKPNWSGLLRVPRKLLILGEYEVIISMDIKTSGYTVGLIYMAIWKRHVHSRFFKLYLELWPAHRLGHVPKTLAIFG
jgi:hypothetical protein